MRAACGGVLFLWIESVLGSRQSGVEVPWFEMTVVCLWERGNSELMGRKRGGARWLEVQGGCMHKLWCCRAECQYGDVQRTSFKVRMEQR